MIRLTGVSYTYPGQGQPALDGLDLEISRGEFLVIMGRNGSGKSTLARLLNGLLTPTKGIVTVEGMDTARRQNLLKIRQRVGMVLSEPDSQFVSNLVEEEVAFGPENLGLSSNQIQARVKEALALVHMEDYAEHPPFSLSGGQKQKVCIASLLAMQPAYMILDEPFSMLDAGDRKALVDILRHLQQERNLTIVLVTHEVENIPAADNIVVLDAGKLVFRDQVEKLPADEETWVNWGLRPPPLLGLARAFYERTGQKFPLHLSPEEMASLLCK